MDVTIKRNGKSWTVPGYFAADGNAGRTGATAGNAWRAHFNPPAAGAYNYSVSLVRGTNVAIAKSPGGSPTTGDGSAGTFRVSAASGSGFNSKGKLSYVGGPYPRFANGEYFVKGGPGSPETFLGLNGTFDGTPNGSTNLNGFGPHVKDWRSGDPLVAGRRGKGVIGSINYVADTAKMNSLYVITLTENGDGKNTFPWPGKISNNRANLFTYDTSKLDQWQTVFTHAYDKGVHLHLLTTETENEQLFEWVQLRKHGGRAFASSRKVYYRELIARFGHLNVTWNIGEEFGGVNDGGGELGSQTGRPATAAQGGDYADFIHSIDPYNSPTVIHTQPNNTSFFRSLVGRRGLDGVSIQSDPGQADDKIRELRRLKGNWAISHDEQGGASDANPCRKDDGFRHRYRSEVLYMALHSGGWGVEWYGGYNTCGNDFNHNNFRDRATQYQDTGYAVRYFNGNLSRRLGSMRPNNSLVKGASSGALVLADAGAAYSIYLPNGGRGGSLSVPKGSYRVRWFNPSRGVFVGSTRNLTGASIALGTAPAGSKDWVVLVTRT